MRIDRARNYIAMIICNFVMNVIATKAYRDTLSMTIQVGMDELDKIIASQK